MKGFRSFACSLILALSVAALTSAADLPSAAPEDVGFSSDRLARIGPVIKGEIDKGQYPGAVMLVVRKGKVVYFESIGQLDPASGKPMTKDAIFRLYSMTKPYVSVAAMMLVEEGRLRLTDPATNTPIKLLDVTVPQKNAAAGAGSVGTAADYARFLQMMINGGQLNGVRLLSRTTVAYMIADHLGDARFSGATTLPPGTGFGLGFALRKETGRFEVSGSAGEYYWAGAAGTGFYVDPKEDLICVWMTQGQPGMARRYDRYLFKQMVYQAIN